MDVPLRERLAPLSRWKTVVFGLAVCERMLPGFRAFAAETGCGGEEVLRASLDRVWDLLGGGLDRRDLSALAAACADVAPDTEDHDAPHTSAALDAAAAVASLMGAVSGDPVEHVAVIASLARDTVDLLVQIDGDLDPNDPRIEEKIKGHPLMRAKMERQRDDLDFIEGLDPDVGVAMPAVRRRWRTGRVSIIEPSARG